MSYRSFRATVERRLAELSARGALLGQVPALPRDSPGRVPALLAGDARPLVRQLVAEHAPLLPQGRRLLLQLLSDPQAEVRCVAIDSLATLLVKKRCPGALLACLDDTDELVRAHAADAIGLAGDRRALKRLWLASRDGVSLVRRDVAAAIGRLADSRDVPRLRQAVKTERSAAARVGFLDALHRLGDRDEALGDLLVLLEHGDYRVRCSAANTLVAWRLATRHARLACDALGARLRREKSLAAREALERCLAKLQRRQAS